MLRFKEVLAIATTAGLLTFGFVAAEARDIKVQRRAEPAKIVAVATPAEKAEVGQAAAERIVHVPACARKVKVVYAGYGEGARASCPTTTAQNAN